MAKQFHLFFILFCSLATGRTLAQTQVSRPALPTPQQVQWHQMERSMFVHFAPNTWQGTELDNRSTPLQRINPSRLDVNQWIDAAESFGARMIIFVAKHGGGFCMWQTETTDYSIRTTPYKNGKGDILQELAEACFRRGMRLGVYIYPGDDTWGAYLGGGGRTKDPAKQEGYNKVLRRQWEEVLSRHGHQIHEIWFDGGLVVPLEDIIKKYAPHAIVFQGPFASIRWLGNEQGIAPYPAWNALQQKDAQTGVATAAHSDPDGDVWMPLEADVTLKDHNWFWSPTNSKNLRSLDQLMDIYYKSVGRGTTLLLNAAPDTTGLIPAEDMALYRQFGNEIERRFGKSLASTAGKGEVVELAFAQPTIVDHVIIQEDIIFGERVRAYVVEGYADGSWKELAAGTAVGFKRIETFEPVAVQGIRVRFTKYSHPPVIQNFSAFHVGSRGAQNDTTATTAIRVGAIEPDATGRFEIDLSQHILMAGQYELSIHNADNEPVKITNPQLVLQGVPTPGFAHINQQGHCNINITAHPSGESASIQVTGEMATAQTGKGQKVTFFLRKIAGSPR